MVLYFCRMFQWRLHVVLWSLYHRVDNVHYLLYGYMRLLAAEPRSTARLLFPSQYLYLRDSVRRCVTGWLWVQVKRCFIDLSCSLPFRILLFYLISSSGLDLGSLVFGLIGCLSLSLPCIAAVYNNNNKFHKLVVPWLMENFEKIFRIIIWMNIQSMALIFSSNIN